MSAQSGEKQKSGNENGLDDDLLATIRKRQESGDLLDQMEDLMKETNAVMDKSSGPKEQESLVSVENAASTERSAAIAMEELKRVLAILEQKEADLELAARIGDALFQENTRLRNEAKSTETLREELEAKEDENASLKEQCNLLQRRVDILIEHLKESEDANADLAEQLREAESTPQRSPHSSPKRGSPKTPPTSAKALSASPFSLNGPWEGQEDTLLSAPASPVEAPPSANSAEERINSLLALEEEVSETWRKRVISLERELSSEKLARIELSQELREGMKALEIERSRAESYLDQLSRAKSLTAQNSDFESAVRERITLLESALRSVQEEKSALLEERDEYKLILLEQTAGSEVRSLTLQAELDGIPSLHSELGGENVQGKDITPIQSPTKQKEEDVDPYFFHFHMTAMTVKAHLSMAGQQTTAEANAGPVSRSVLDTINAMDTKVMYKDVIDKSIPPHHWIGYIKDCFATTHVKALINDAKAGSMRLGEGDRGWLQLAGQSIDESDVRDSSSPSQSGRPPRPNFFSSLLQNLTASPSRARKEMQPSNSHLSRRVTVHGESGENLETIRNMHKNL